jgi:hypothetical protein
MARLLGSVHGHLTAHRLTTPLVSVAVGHDVLDDVQVTVHLRSSLLPGLAVSLLAWADTLTRIAVTAWLPPRGGRVHLNLIGEQSDGTRVVVYGGVEFSAELFGDLQPGGRQGVALSVLRSWAAGATGVAA